VRQDVAILEPAPRDAGGDDDDVPRRRVGRRFALTVDHADAKVGGAENLLGDGTDGERLPRPGTGNDAKAAAGAGELPHARTVVLLEVRLDVESHRELDRLAGGSRGCDDDDAPGGRLGPDECGVVGREVLISYVAHAPRMGEKRASALRLLSGVAPRIGRAHPSSIIRSVVLVIALPVLAKLPDEWRALSVALVGSVHVVVTE